MQISSRCLIFLIACAFLIVAGCDSSPSDATPPGANMQLGTLMHLWYGIDPQTGECRGGLGSSHWDETVLVEPEQGFYCSLDQAVIERQIQQMRSVGINWILLSWWGEGSGQPIFRANHEATLKVLQHLQALNELGGTMKATILVEPWLATGSDFTPLVEIPESEKEAIWTLINNQLYRPHRDI